MFNSIKSGLDYLLTSKDKNKACNSPTRKKQKSTTQNGDIHSSNVENSIFGPVDKVLHMDSPSSSISKEEDMDFNIVNNKLILDSVHEGSIDASNNPPNIERKVNMTS